MQPRVLRSPRRPAGNLPARGLPLLLLLLISCELGAPASSPSETPSRRASYDGTWELVEGRASEGPIEISERWRITLTIDGEELGGLSACNHYGATATIKGDAISITGVGGTEMGCHPEVMETEARYHSALMAVDTIERSGATLVLAGPDAELVFGFVPPPPTADLTDVRWNLQSLIHGQGPDATVTSAHPAHLYFTSDGRFEGWTGCRAIEGEWIEQADRVDFTSFGAKEGDCSDSLTEQNDAVINLGDGFTFDIEGDTLTVYGRFSEIGLQYKAKATSGSSQEEGTIRGWKAPRNYSFRVRSRCGEQSFIGTFHIVVANGEIADAKGLDESAVAALRSMGKDIPTLTDLLDYAVEAEQEDADVVDVVFDESDGHPKKIEIDYDAAAIDDESCFFITDYEPDSSA